MQYTKRPRFFVCTQTASRKEVIYATVYQPDQLDRQQELHLSALYFHSHTYETISAFMPPHRVYIEPCMGSAEVFLRKRPAEKEIINDYNGDLVNFFRVLRSKKALPQLLGRLYLSFNSEELFIRNKKLLASIPNILDDAVETAEAIQEITDADIEHAAAFFENQVSRKDMTKRFPRLVAACNRLRDAIIMHRDYKDVITYAACPGAFILLDPPYKGTENMYQKSSFDEDEHAKLFAFMNGIHVKFGGECKFLITYNNDPYIRSLAERYGFDTYVQERLHNMAQGSKPGEMFEELLIANYDLMQQAVDNHHQLANENSQLSLFDYICDY